MSAPTGFTTVSAALLQDASGNLITNATIFFSPVANNGTPISFRAGGAEGQVSARCVQAPVVNGVFSIVLADTTLTTPINVGYSVSCICNLSGRELLGAGYGCVQPSGSTWSFDTYQPNLAPQVTIQTGPRGPQGDVSGIELATAISGEPTNLFVPSKITTAGNISITDGTFASIGPGDTRFYATDFFVVNPGGTISANEPGQPAPYGTAFYDTSKTFISGSAGVAAFTAIAVPANAVFARMSFIATSAPSPTLVIMRDGLTPTSAYVYPGTSVEASAAIQTAANVGDTIATYVRNDSQVNIFNPNTVTADMLLTVGGALTDLVDSRYFVSDYMLVRPGGTVITNNTIATAYGWGFYDQNKTWLSGATCTSGVAVSVPANAVFARLSLYTGAGVSLAEMMVMGDLATLPTSYVFPGLTPLASAAIETAANTGGAIASYIRQDNPANVFNPLTVTPEATLNTGGGIAGLADGRYFVSDYMLVVGGGTVITNNAIAAGYGWGFYDQNKTFISGANCSVPNVAVTVPANAVYARLSIYTGTVALSGLVVLCNQASLPSAGDITPPASTTPTVVAPAYVFPGVSLAGSLAITAQTRPAVGKRWYHVGDSISAIYGGSWLPSVLSNTGLIQVGQDAHTGRPTGAIFEYYGNNSSGVYTGPDPVNGIAGDPGASGIQNVWADGQTHWDIVGKTLPQVLTAAAPDLITIFLGANDEGYTIGTPSDPITAGTEYGNIRAALVGYINAYPTARLLWIAPYINVQSTAASGISTAIKNVCAQYGVPVLDLNANSGINPLNFSHFLLGDNLHPQGRGFNMLINLVSDFINRQMY